MRAFNKGVEEASHWTTPVFASPQDEAEEPNVAVWAYFVILLACLAIIIGLFLLLRLAILRQRRRKHSGHPAALLKPIVRAQGSTGTTSQYLINNETGNHYTDQLLRDVSFNSSSGGRRSCQDPLPPVPGKEEHIYSDIRAAKREEEEEMNLLAKKTNSLKRPEIQGRTSPRKDSIGGGASVGKPLTLQLEVDDDDYLAPTSAARVPSRESLDDEGYLRPNFNRFQRLDTNLATPESPPPIIPPVSYRPEKADK